MGFFKPNVERMKAKGDVEGLIKALRHKIRPTTTGEIKDGFISIEAAGALRDIGKPAVDPLIEALNDEDSGARMLAAKTLGEIGDARAVEPLTKALRDEEEYVQRYAKEALELIKVVSGTGTNTLREILLEAGFLEKDINDLARFSPSLFTKLVQIADELVSRERSRASKLGLKKVELSPWAYGQVTEMAKVVVEIREKTPLSERMKRPVLLFDKFAKAVRGNELSAHEYVVKVVEKVIKKSLKKLEAKKS